MSRVAAATMVGTTVEWYDFFLYATAAGVVFNELFFTPAGAEMARIIAFFSTGISFVFRPIGGFVAGHLGDKLGRKPLLVLTLVMMGISTFLIGCLPTYYSIGVLAPIMLITLRILQGLSAGGEWGGAAMMAVEHAPVEKRGFYGAMPQLGVPLGLVLSNAVLALMQTIAPGDAFLAWGWRVPFMLSVVLIGVGYWVRRSVDESPVFVEIEEREKKTKLPIVQLFRYFFPLVILSALVFAGMNAAGYMTTGGFIQSYATNTLEMNTSLVLWIVSVAGITWGIFAVLAGWASDRMGRRGAYIFGYIVQGIALVVLFPLVNTATGVGLLTGLVFLTLGLGFTYGPLASWYAELFPASVRFSGVSIAYALGALLGGAFSPLVAEALLQATGSTTAITIYLIACTLLALLATILLRDRKRLNLSIENDEKQRQGLYIWQKPIAADAYFAADKPKKTSSARK